MPVSATSPLHILFHFHNNSRDVEYYHYFVDAATGITEVSPHKIAKMKFEPRPFVPKAKLLTTLVFTYSFVSLMISSTSVVVGFTSQLG